VAGRQKDRIVDPVFIAPHVVEQARKRLSEKFEFLDERQAMRLCAGMIYKAQGPQLLLFPARSVSYQQVAQPFIHQMTLRPLGYIVLDQEKKKSTGAVLVAKTWLDLDARQIIEAEPGPLPQWYLSFQKSYCR
jgi:hypothetical protein